MVIISTVKVVVLKVCTIASAIVNIFVPPFQKAKLLTSSEATAVEKLLVVKPLVSIIEVTSHGVGTAIETTFEAVLFLTNKTDPSALK